MIDKYAFAFAVACITSSAFAQGDIAPSDGSVLPFSPTPTASVAAPTLQQSKMVRRVEESHLPKDAPNILVILLDDVGFGLPDTYGGPIHTPTLSRIANEGSAITLFTQRRFARPRARLC